MSHFDHFHFLGFIMEFGACLVYVEPIPATCVHNIINLYHAHIFLVDYWCMNTTIICLFLFTIDMLICSLLECKIQLEPSLLYVSLYILCYISLFIDFCSKLYMYLFMLWYYVGVDYYQPSWSLVVVMSIECGIMILLDEMLLIIVYYWIL